MAQGSFPPPMQKNEIFKVSHHRSPGPIVHKKMLPKGLKEIIIGGGNDPWAGKMTFEK